MIFSEYLDKSARTLSAIFNVQDQVSKDLLHGAIGLVTECSELLDNYDKSGNRTGQLTGLGSIEEELGDLMWYMAIMHRNYGTDLGEIKPEHADLDEWATVLGLTKMSAELLDIHKKSIFYGRTIDVVKSLSKISDITSLVAQYIKVTELDAARIMDINIKKLELRMGGTSFSAQKVHDRDLNAENELLKSK